MDGLSLLRASFASRQFFVEEPQGYDKDYSDFSSTKVNAP